MTQNAVNARPPKAAQAWHPFSRIPSVNRAKCRKHRGLRPKNLCRFAAQFGENLVEIGLKPWHENVARDQARRNFTSVPAGLTGSAAPKDAIPDRILALDAPRM